MPKKFPTIELSGTPHEIGIAHGRTLKERIEKSIEFYTDVTKKLDQKGREENVELILKAAQSFIPVIKRANSEYITEIEGIAEGSEQDPLWIYALNARSEIMSNMENGVTECTALYFKPSGLLGQNWDWAADFEDLAVLMTIQKEGYPKILQMTEPGIIGKIGMNSIGIGVTLNFLHQSEKMEGVPIHIILRSILESSSFEVALDVVRKMERGQSGNIIIGSDDGRYQNVEFAGQHRLFSDNQNPIQIHTNHYLEDASINISDEFLESSLARYDRATTMKNEVLDYTFNEMKSILLDGTNFLLPICRPYVEGRVMKDVGSVCSMIMELRDRTMWITHGTPIDHPYTKHTL